jgi:hypothetical protein
LNNEYRPMLATLAAMNCSREDLEILIDRSFGLSGHRWRGAETVRGGLRQGWSCGRPAFAYGASL